MDMMVKYYLLLIFGFLPVLIFGQTTDLEYGEISFTNSSHVYVRFDGTGDIEIGDTLYLKDEVLIPCLIVKMKSSSSVVCERLERVELKKGMTIILPRKTATSGFEDSEMIDDDIDEESLLDTLEDQSILVDEGSNPTFTQKTRARVSVAGFSNLSPQENSDRHRLLSRFSLRTDHINDSPISFETYISYRQNFTERVVSDSYQNKFFRIYSAAVSYSIDSTSSVTLGRKINRKFSSVGAIDGLQLEKRFGRLSVGLIGGFKPDISKFDLNTKLLQLGGYANYQTTGQFGYSSTTLGLMEQRNTGAVDRRYMYFQSTNSVGRKLKLFISAELDLYSNVAGISKTKLRLTNLFSSLRFRLNRKINISLSYDNRRRILFYETLKTEIEQLLEDDIARQGLRLRVNWKPLRNISLGLGLSRRFQSDQQNASENANLYISHSKIPGLGASLTMRINVNRSNYLESKIASISLSKNLFNKNLQARLYYRFVNYRYLESVRDINQSYIGTNLNYRLSKSLRFGISAEMNRRDQLTYYSFQTKLIKRF